ncbi:NAD(P)/FAD-dependent oxidoreductase [Aeromonas veronii]
MCISCFFLAACGPKMSDFEPNTSYWFKEKPAEESAPLAQDMKVDIAIIGGGYSGLSSAWHLAKANPSLKIAIFEAKQVGSGASGRNGGMVLPGSEVMDLYEGGRRASATTISPSPACASCRRWSPQPASRPTSSSMAMWRRSSMRRISPSTATM